MLTQHRRRRSNPPTPSNIYKETVSAYGPHHTMSLKWGKRYTIMNVQSELFLHLSEDPDFDRSKVARLTVAPASSYASRVPSTASANALTMF